MGRRRSRPTRLRRLQRQAIRPAKRPKEGNKDKEQAGYEQWGVATDWLRIWGVRLHENGVGIA